jgi:tetratricopeptide (TPR) repeat protein
MACATPNLTGRKDRVQLNLGAFFICTRSGYVAQDRRPGALATAEVTYKMRYYSKDAKGSESPPVVSYNRLLLRWATGLLVALLSFCLGGRTAAAEGEPRTQAQQVYREKEKHFLDERKKLDPAWQFGRACFDLAEFATNSTERAQLAERGINACRQALAINSNSAPGHYYLGLNLGQLARTKSMGALKLVTQMEREFTNASDLDASFDFGGPDRSLGLLYRDAPTLISIGNRSKAKQHLRRAVELAPEFPENRLDLIESYLKWGDRNEARRELTALESVWPGARTKFQGPDWTASWKDWQARLEDLKKKIEEASKLETPRH